MHLQPSHFSFGPQEGVFYRGQFEYVTKAQNIDLSTTIKKPLSPTILVTINPNSKNLHVSGCCKIVNDVVIGRVRSAVNGQDKFGKSCG